MGEFIIEDTFHAIVAGEKETFLPILNDLETHGAMLLMAIHQGIKAGDIDQVRKAAHQLKGSSGMLGMHRVYALCKEAEREELSEISPMYYDELKEAFKQSLTAAKELLSHF